MLMTNRSRSWHTDWLAILTLAAMAMGCEPRGEETAAPADDLGRDTAAYVVSQSEPVAYALTTMPTSGVVLSGDKGVICYSSKGDELWRWEATGDDEIIAAPGIAPDSSVFVLTSQSLVSISVAGQVEWSIEVGPAEIPGVVALGDGTVAVTSGSNALVGYRSGQRVWRFEMPDGDTIVSLPSVSSNSRIFVQGTARLYVVDASGVPVWDRPL